MSICWILGNRVDVLTLETAVERIASFIASGTPHHVVTLNAEIAYRASKEPRLQKIINRAHMVSADGYGIVWASRVLGNPLPGRVTGIDLMQALAAEGAKKGWRFYFYGAAPGVAEGAAANLKDKYPGLKVAGINHGYIMESKMPDLLAAIRAARPHILLVALGAPKQEYWIAEHLYELQVPVAMGVGGSFDVLAGVTRRAPEWIQRLNLEWLYRIVKGRRFGRALALPKYILAVKKEARKGSGTPER